MARGWSCEVLYPVAPETPRSRPTSMVIGWLSVGPLGPVAPGFSQLTVRCLEGVPPAGSRRGSRQTPAWLGTEPGGLFQGVETWAWKT